MYRSSPYDPADANQEGTGLVREYLSAPAIVRSPSSHPGYTDHPPPQLPPHILDSQHAMTSGNSDYVQDQPAFAPDSEAFYLPSGLDPGKEPSSYLTLHSQVFVHPYTTRGVANTFSDIW